MANVNAPIGLRPVGSLAGSPYSGSIRQYSVPASDATAIFIGDPVKNVGTSQIINGQVFADVAQAATGDIITGVVVGAVPVSRESFIYRAASTQRLLYVADDPDLICEAQQVAGGTPLTANDIGLNVNFAVGTGNTYTGQSAVTLDNTTEATTNTLDLKIVSFINRADNDPGTAVGTGADASRFYVKINRHRFANQIAGV